MNTYKLLFLILLLNCAKTIAPSTDKTKETALESLGFTKMVVIESKDTTCEFLLKDKDNTSYEVLDLKKIIETPKNGQILWVKFVGLRRKSVCGAQPISITEFGK